MEQNFDYKKMYEELLVKYKKQEIRFNRMSNISDSHAKELKQLNSKLKEMSNTDPMTGAYNRRYFFNISENIISIAKNENYDIFIAMIDIDKFKMINDTYGHDVGDIIIKDLVANISKGIRSNDCFARFGGEEFVILFNNTSKDATISICERLRKTIEDSKPYNDVKYTISIGISKLSDEANSIEEAIKMADLALYESKENGRNKVTIKL